MKNKNMSLELHESINKRIKEPTVNGYDHKAAPDYIQVMFNRLNDVQGSSWYPFVLRDVKLKIMDIQEKINKGVCKPV